MDAGEMFADVRLVANPPRLSLQLCTLEHRQQRYAYEQRQASSDASDVIVPASRYCNHDDF